MSHPSRVQKAQPAQEPVPAQNLEQALSNAMGNTTAGNKPMPVATNPPPEAKPAGPKRVGDILLEGGHVTKEQLD